MRRSYLVVLALALVAVACGGEDDGKGENLAPGGTGGTAGEGGTGGDAGTGGMGGDAGTGGTAEAPCATDPGGAECLACAASAMGECQGSGVDCSDELLAFGTCAGTNGCLTDGALDMPCMAT